MNTTHRPPQRAASVFSTLIVMYEFDKGVVRLQCFTVRFIGIHLSEVDDCLDRLYTLEGGPTISSSRRRRLGGVAVKCLSCSKVIFRERNNVCSVVDSRLVANVNMCKGWMIYGLEIKIGLKICRGLKAVLTTSV
ncbi:hypothetical protein NPIL_335921 [Nephila pilipes]|uniref:Uncharacterized protein n=1 Tax=Nephila pilipes TaxID=299642 RepID=A0A8X6PE99_NEPPI|nr:hypothetical protein NPIL_335921 [Nephila pilipes]